MPAGHSISPRSKAPHSAMGLPLLPSTMSQGPDGMQMTRRRAAPSRSASLPIVDGRTGQSTVLDSLEREIATVSRQHDEVLAELQRRTGLWRWIGSFLPWKKGSSRNKELENRLRWLRKKEGQLREEKILVLLRDVSGQYGYHPPSDDSYAFEGETNHALSISQQRQGHSFHLVRASTKGSGALVTPATAEASSGPSTGRSKRSAFVGQHADTGVFFPPSHERVGPESSPTFDEARTPRRHILRSRSEPASAADVRRGGGNRLPDSMSPSPEGIRLDDAKPKRHHLRRRGSLPTLWGFSQALPKNKAQIRRASSPSVGPKRMCTRTSSMPASFEDPVCGQPGRAVTFASTDERLNASDELRRRRVHPLLEGRRQGYCSVPDYESRQQRSDPAASSRAELTGPIWRRPTVYRAPKSSDEYPDGPKIKTTSGVADFLQLSDCPSPLRRAWLHHERHTGKHGVSVMDVDGPPVLPALSCPSTASDKVTASSTCRSPLAAPDASEGNVWVVVDDESASGRRKHGIAEQANGQSRRKSAKYPSSARQTSVNNSQLSSLTDPLPSCTVQVSVASTRETSEQRSSSRRSFAVGTSRESGQSTLPRRDLFSPSAMDAGVGDEEALATTADTLRNVHGRLSAAFALADAADSGQVLPKAVWERLEQRAAITAADDPRAAGAVEAETPPRIWLTRYEDKSKRYGLGYLLSNGGAGVAFKDGTQIALDSKGVYFDYFDRCQEASRATVVGEGAGGVGEEQSGGPLIRYSLENHPPHIQKKATILRKFRDHLLRQSGDGWADDAPVACQPSPRTTGYVTPVADEDSGAVSVKASDDQEPLANVAEWKRTRSSWLFQLSTGTVQVVFLDNTEILLSEDARLVTFVDKSGERETLSLHRVLEERRSDIAVRVRECEVLIAKLLVRREDDTFVVRRSR